MALTARKGDTTPPDPGAHLQRTTCPRVSADDAEQFAYLRAYSPYHNVREGIEYPAVLFETGDGDTHVAPLHARRMTALMQASTGSDRPILLRYDTEACHSGGLPVSKTIEDLTTRLSFVMWRLGMLGPAAS